MYCCSLHETIFVPSRLTPNADIHMFKAGVEPKWEDPECANGGKWTYVVTNNRKQAFDKAWLETVLFSSSSSNPFTLLFCDLIILSLVFGS